MCIRDSTKVVFPLPILSAVTVCAALFHAGTSLVILLLFEVISGHGIPLSIFALPLTWLPGIAGFLSLSWILSALGVFLRDLDQVMGVCTNLLMFLSAVFYPLSALPQQWQPVLRLNPLVVLIEQTRLSCIEGQTPSAMYVLGGLVLTTACCEISFRAFQKASKGFADVL